MSGLRIAFFGSSILSSYWNGAATYYRGIVRAMHRLGHQVTFYEPDAYQRQQHRDIEPPDWVRSVVYSGQDPRELERHLQAAREADIAIKASGVGVFDQLLEAAVCDLRQHGVQTVYWDVDAPATLDRLDADPADPLRALIPRYDLVLTYGGGPPVVDAFTRLGARACHPIYNAHDPETHHPPAATDPRFDCDLAFLGNRLPDREARVAEFLLRPAQRLDQRRFLIGGSGWPEARLPANVEAIGHVGSAQHNQFNATPLAVLNINRASMASYGYSPATRIFEAAAAGACIISDAWTGIDRFLEPGQEILVAQDGDEVAALLEDLDRERARSIGTAARRRALDQHTYQRRAAQLSSLLLGHSHPVEM